MDVGLTIPTRGPLATPDGIETIVRRAEEQGFAHLSVSDHLVVPRSIESRYPYSASGAWPGAARATASSSSRSWPGWRRSASKPRLITAVAVIPYRGAVHTAKIAATIDVLSHGRMVLGAGAGWLKEEFEALERAAVRGARPGHRRMAPGLQDPLDRGGSALRGPPRPLRRRQLHAQARAEAASADLGRRRKPAALRRTVRYGDSLVPDRQQPASPARHGGAIQGRRRSACIARRSRTAGIRRASGSRTTPAGSTRPGPSSSTTASATC